MQYFTSRAFSIPILQLPLFLIIYISVIDLQDILGFQYALSELLTHHVGH